MIDEIFELVMKEARSKPGKDLKLKAYYVVNELYMKVYNAFVFNPEGTSKSNSKDDKPA